MHGTPESIDVALHEDDVRVVRHPIERDDHDMDTPAGAFLEMEIEIPLRGEEIVVHKRPVVRDEVVVRKVLRARMLPKSQTLRRETVQVDGDYIDDAVHDVRLERSRSL